MTFLVVSLCCAQFDPNNFPHSEAHTPSLDLRTQYSAIAPIWEKTKEWHVQFGTASP